MSRMVIVESVTCHLGTWWQNLIVPSVLAEGRNRADHDDDSKVMMIKDPLLLLGGLVTEFPGRYII